MRQRHAVGGADEPCRLPIERTSDFPMMAERIDDAAEAPAVLVTNRSDLLRPSRHGPREHRVRILNDEHHPDRSAAKRLWTEIRVLRRLVGDPKLRSIDREPGDDRAIRRIDAEHFSRA